LLRTQEQKKKDAEAEAARKQKEAEEKMSSEDRLNLENGREAEKKKLLGNDFYKKKNFPEAIENYRAAIELNPKELTFYSNLAAVYVEMNELDKAIECCDNAIEKAKEGNYDYAKLGKAKARKALCLFKQEKLDESIDMYKEALLEHNSYDIKQAKIKVEKRKKELAEQAYFDPALAEQQKDKGNELFKAGDFPGAIKEFDEGVRRDPKNKFIYSNRCAAYLKLMDPVSALKDAEKALELDKDFVKAWARKGTAHQMSKEYHKALDAYKKGLAIDPNSKECIDG
jgi:stress-induced-phosphoprotein 1